MIKNPEIELRAHKSYKMLDYRLQIANGELSIRNIDELCGISGEEKVICLFKLADRAHNSSDIKAAYLKAKEISNNCSDDLIKIKALSRILEAQIKHKISGAKATFKEIEKMLNDVSDQDLDQETWGRIALADFELNYKAWSFNSLKFWA